MINVFRRMEYLIKLNEKARVEGLNYYTIKIGGRLSDHKIKEFENRHQISLPADYRKFISDYANGIQGTLMDVLSLSQYFSLYKSSDKYDEYLSTPFEFDDHSPYCPTHKSYVSETTGTLAIHKNKTGYDLLVVSGKDYGSIWNASREKGLGIQKVSSSFRKYLDERIDVKIRSLVDQERLNVVLNKDSVLCLLRDRKVQSTNSVISVLKINTKVSYDLILSESSRCDSQLEEHLNITFSFTQIKEIRRSKLNGNYYFENAKDRNDELPEYVCKTKILESYFDSFNERYYVKCRFNNFDKDMYIITSKDMSSYYQKEVVFRGLLTAIIK